MRLASAVVAHAVRIVARRIGPCSRVRHVSEAHWVELEVSDSLVDMAKTCPMDVKNMLFEAAEESMWLKWTQQPEFSHLAPRPIIAPVRAAAGGRRQSSALGPRPAIIRALAVDGAWTQERLHRAGRAEHSYCLACSTEPPSIGTAHHRFY